RPHGGDGREDVLPALLGVGADHDRDARGAGIAQDTVSRPVSSSGEWRGRRRSARRLERSPRMTFSTRKPSRTARRLLVPWMRRYSWLGISCTFRPALTTPMFIRVSISKPVQSRSILSRQCRQKAL